MSPAAITRIAVATALLGIAAAAMQSCTRQATTPKQRDNAVPGGTASAESNSTVGSQKLGIEPGPSDTFARRLSESATNGQMPIRARELRNEGTTSPGDVWRVKNGAPNAPLIWVQPDAAKEYPGDRYTRVDESPFKATLVDPLSTFSIDVDTASYTNVHRFLNKNTMPPPDAVRIEEFINYFRYDYPAPTGPHPVHVTVDGGPCPWEPEHKLVRIGIRGKDLVPAEMPPLNLVFLVDVSGSMFPADRLPMLINGLPLMLDQLSAKDSVSIVTYAGSTRVALEPTRGSDRETITAAFNSLRSGGSTAGASGIQLAYECAERAFIKGGSNRIILCTDGDFNVGISNTGELTRLVEEKAKSSGVYLSVIGVGRGNLNDEMLEEITNRGNGSYYYAGSMKDAKRILVEDLAGTVYTIAKDVKVQVEFNPALVQAFRLVGYENRHLAHEDFNDDTKDAGDMGAGHTVTALYEIVPSGVDMGDGNRPVDPLKYSHTVEPRDGTTNEWLTVKVRYQQPEGSRSELLEVALANIKEKLSECDDDFIFAACVANFGKLLRSGDETLAMGYEDTAGLIESTLLSGRHEDRAELLSTVRKVAGMAVPEKETSMR